MTRRTLTRAGTAIGFGLLIGIAGCSGDGNGHDDDSMRSTGQQPAEERASEERYAMTETQQSGPSVRGVRFEMADGSLATMDEFQGRVVLVVNTASRCGLTPQVGQLETLQQANAGKPFTVLAFPSASFNQEPLASAEAASFCADMGATYPVAAKVDVKGESAHPLFATLSEQGGEPTWNFTKYLVDKDGNVVARFDPRTEPTSAEIQSAIDAALRG